MVPANSASTEAGVESRSATDSKLPEMRQAENGRGPEVALSQGVSADAGGVSAARPAGNSDSVSEGGSGTESAAAHLAGFSAAEIQLIDEKFQRVLDTVHANRPGDDLEIIRKAWEFCLEHHE